MDGQSWPGLCGRVKRPVTIPLAACLATSSGLLPAAVLPRVRHHEGPAENRRSDWASLRPGSADHRQATDRFRNTLVRVKSRPYRRGRDQGHSCRLQHNGPSFQPVRFLGMEPPEDRSAEIRRHLGELMPSAGSGVSGALVGAAIGGPVGAVVGAGAGAVLDHVIREALRRRRDRGEQALELAAVEANLTSEQLLERILADERLLELAAAVIAAAAETALDAKIRALGQALARGTLATDDAMIDTERFIVGTLAVLDASHVRVLGQINQRYDDYGEEFGPDGGRLAYGWTLEALSEYLSWLTPVLRPVLGTLTANGLIRDTAIGALEYRPRWVVTEYGEQVLRMLEEAAESP